MDIFPNEPPCQEFLISKQVEFFLNRQKDFARLAVAVAEREQDATCQICHDWIGICEPYGFAYLATCAQELTAAVKSKDWRAAERHLPKIAAYFEHKRVSFGI